MTGLNQVYILNKHCRFWSMNPWLWCSINLGENAKKSGLVLVWYWCGISVVLVWYKCGISVALVWHRCGISLEKSFESRTSGSTFSK